MPPPWWEYSILSVDSQVATYDIMGRFPVGRPSTPDLPEARVPCTGCRYCLPCPHGVAIPNVLGCYNEISDDLERARMPYNWLDEKTRGDACIVRVVPRKCPQGIDIREWMKLVHEALVRHE